MNNYKEYIFDIDYTILIPDWSKEDIFFSENILPEEQEEFFKQKQNILIQYENDFTKYELSTLSKFFKRFGFTVSVDTIEKWMTYNGENIIDTVVDGVEELFKLLKDNGKRIVILTNWFSGTQIPRLKRSGLYKYVDKIVAGDDAMKSSTKAFEIAIGDYDKKDCLMIGDSIRSDKVGADKVGIDSYIVNDDVHTIRNLYNEILREVNNNESKK